MTREKQLAALHKSFDDSAKGFQLETEGLFCEITYACKGKDAPQNLKFRFARIFYNSFAVNFIYTAHGFLGNVNSILSCCVCFDKNSQSLGIPLPFITDQLNIDVSIPLFLPLITNEACMAAAYSALGGVVKDILPQLEAVASDADKKEQLYAALNSEAEEFFGITIEDDNDIDLYTQLISARLCTDAYINYLKGDVANAIKQLKKQKRLTSYEKRTVGLWQHGDAVLPDSLEAIKKNASLYNSKGVQKVNLKEFFSLFLSWLVLTPVVSLFYSALYFLFVTASGHDAIYVLGVEYNYPFCIVAGFVTAIGLSYFVRHGVYKLLFKKDYAGYIEMDHIQNGKNEDKLMRGFLGVLVLLGTVLCIMLANWNMVFNENGFWDNSKFFALKGTYYSYDRVERVYYKEQRVNSLGETLDAPSYVIVLDDGTELDLYQLSEPKDFEENLLTLFKSKGKMQ